MTGAERHLGIVLEYDTEKEIAPRVALRHSSAKAGKGVVGMIGAGNFARNLFYQPSRKKQCCKVSLRQVRTMPVM